MDNYKTRLETEEKELNEKINKLNSFIDSEDFNNIVLKQQALLRMQLTTMNKYSSILKERMK